jgi:hypothetical protein
MVIAPVAVVAVRRRETACVRADRDAIRALSHVNSQETNGKKWRARELARDPAWGRRIFMRHVSIAA